ncbi:hypothetical protein IMAU10031_00635 [Lactobacillus helveticus]|nr:hypothetical protein [Lactobacillus helveticus]NRO75773.1 hypothetical protein [Lactobacillus helveticus]
MTSLINNKTLLNLQNKIFTTDLLPDNIIQSSLFDITRDKKHYFLQFNLSDKKLPHQGFKIHVSCTEENFQSILNTIYNFCIQHKVSFKYISNLENLLNNLSGKSSIWSSGKFITIYPESLSSFKEIITQLYSLKAFQLKKGITISS